jgi:hypothetical protein
MLTCNFWYGAEIIYNRKKEDETCDAEVRPLYVLQRRLVGSDMIEEYVRSQDWCYYSPDTIESLCDVDPNLRVLWRSTNYSLSALNWLLEHLIVPAR